MQPTPEQHDAIELFASGMNLAIEAGAGTGKTTTLVQLARSTSRSGQYVAFNRAIVDDSKRKMPANVSARTAHSLAMGAVGHRFRHRIGGGRVRSDQIARQLGIGPLVVSYGSQRKVLQPGFLASHAMRAIRNFCFTADPEPTALHIAYIDGIDAPESDGRRGWKNNDVVRDTLAPMLPRIWSDLCAPDGTLPYSHDHYLKLWERSEPKMGVDFVLFDEAQDAAPVMLSIIDQQEHAQRVYVGDSCQQIYEWRGAVNALQTVDTDARTFLTQSFRFGQAVADLANLVLDELGAELRLRGFDSIPSRVDALSKPDAILTRTNAAAIHEVLTLQAGGVAAHLVGGADDVASFARAAQQLMDGKPTYHPELACFTSWPEVKEYCLDPSTRVLCTDLIWREIDTIAVGDELLGFDEHAGVGTSGRKYQRALVESTQRIVRPCWRVWFDDGTEVVASTEHRWLVGYGSANLKWQTTDRLRIGTRMATVGRPWTRDETHDGGWIAGIFDGEGWLTKRTSADAQRGSASIGVSQKPGPVLDRMMLLLKEREFEFARRDYTSASTLTITGGVAERLRLMGTLRPTRLLDGFVDTLIGRRVEARRTTCVVGVEYVGEREVVALGTSTSTFIAEGLHSHNCVIDPSGDELRLLVDLIEEFTVPTILRALDNVCPENQAQCVVSTAHKSKGREWRSVRLAGDFDRPDGETALSAGEWRLLYVALTRAREVLDMRACAPLVSLVAEHEMVDVVDVPADL